MKTIFQKFTVKILLWILKSSEIAKFDGIILADPRNRDNRTPHFQEIIFAALQLLKATDRCRYARVRRRLAWVTYARLAIRGSAEYAHSTRTCSIDLLEPSADYAPDFLAGWYASILVHEATHGEIASRGIQYSLEHRVRIERLCVIQEQKFIRRLAVNNPTLAAHLHYEFDAANWNWSWNATRWERLKIEMRRILFPGKNP
jgi:hypothetical protein